MRLLLLFLLFLFLCSPLLAAVEYQPTSQEWDNMVSLGDTTVRTYAGYLQEIQRLIDFEKTRPTDDQPRLKLLTSTLGSMQKKHDDLSTLLTDEKALTPEGRTRQKYAQLLHAIKHAAYQCTLDREELLKTDMLPGPGSYPGPDLIRESHTPYIAPTPLPKGLTLSWFDFPTLDGSTTAQPLSTLIACRLLGMGAEWYVRKIEDFRNNEGTSERILIPSLHTPYQPERTHGVVFNDTPNLLGLRVEMAHSGTGNAYRNLITGAADLIIVARPPSPDETALAQAKQVEFALCPIGYDAFIFLLNAKNPVNSLTVKQLQDIYTDNVLNWSEVGGNTQPVVAFQREHNSGSQETMERLVMKGLEIAPPLTQLIGYGMGGPYNKMSRTENGISYSFYYYHTVQSPESPASLTPYHALPSMKLCAVNGIIPSPETIRNRSYPFVTEVYAVVRKAMPATSTAVRLRDWLLTPEGQGVVQESGYVPLPK